MESIKAKNVLEFFNVICRGGPDNDITWVFLPEQNEGAPGILHATFERACPILQRKNQEGFGIFFMVNQGDGQGRKGVNVKRVRALFADLDDDRGREGFFNFALEPHAIIETSPGKFHQYWLVDNVQLEEFSIYQKRIAKTLGTDVNICDLPRVMRAPGFLHQKGAAFESKVVILNEGLPAYSKADFDVLLLEPESPKTTPTVAGSGACDISITEAEECLSYLPIEFSDDHELWLKTIMAIHAEFGSAGEGLAAKFSARSAKYDEKAFLKRYRSFSQGGGRTFRTVIYDAMRYGYIQAPQVEVIDDAEEEAFQNAVNAMIRNSAARERKRRHIVPESLVSKAPGLVGEIVSWMTETAYLPQPVLNLGAALALVGTLKGHRVATESNLRSNLYICGLAPSGSGKNHPLQSVKQLLVAAGQENLFAGKPASDSGLIKLLADGQGRRIILYDEFGKVLSRLTDNRSGTHQKAIVETMMELFSSASSIYLGKEYANHDGRMGRLDVNQPCLSVFAVSTINRFYEALSKGLAADGFLARWLVFEVESGKMMTTNDQRVDREPPGYFVDEINRICNMPTCPQGGNLAGLTIRPRVVPFENDARELARWLENHYRLKARDASFHSDALASIYRRAAEYIQKVALVVSDSLSITLIDMEFAAELVGFSVESLAAATDERIASGPAEAKAKKVIQIIRDSGASGITRTELGRAARPISTREQAEILRDYASTGEIIIEKIKGKRGRPKEVCRMGK